MSQDPAAEFDFPTMARALILGDKDTVAKKTEEGLALSMDPKALIFRGLIPGMAMHFAGTPVSCMANVHCAAATENFLALENHSVDVAWWGDLVDGIEKPIVNKGFITVPDKPGLGITLNEAAVKQHLREPGYFLPTPEWNTDRTSDRQWS